MAQSNRRSMFSNQPWRRPPRFRWRLLLFTLLLVALTAYAYTHNIVPPWPFLPQPGNEPRSSWWQPNSPRPELSLSAQAVYDLIQTTRTQQELPAATSNATLEKTARLATLEVEDNQSIETPIAYETLLKAVSLTRPPEVESQVLFVQGFGEIETVLKQANSKIMSDRSFTQLGVATRPATLEGAPGIIVVILGSPEFADSASNQGVTNHGTSTAPQPATPPSFTGQDLWQAVQNYRRGHQLPTFDQSNELCTVASIRLNELLELGKLDNHDGFGARADEFFEKNKGWTSINENLASGYATAVQTVEWGWDQSLGHQALIKSQEYPKACAAANRGFAVLITGK